MSTPERARQIALAAMQLETQQQAEYLKLACAGDVAFLKQVLKELARLTADTPTSDSDSASEVSPSQDDFEYESLAQPESEHDDASSTSQLSIGPGTVIAGKYKLMQLIGEGGMGAVWLAEQTAPVRRSVAVKLIKPGSDSQQVVARFEAERQALAVMDHPNIAKILDGGSLSDNGAPFFVMELVKGTPITKFCDSQRMALADRLQLFISVCDAIQHAHQKGVIHRDIKPSNILVAMADGKPVPKVIDFGVAKATGLSLTDKTLFTLAGAVVGTPQYMSPEQADPECKDVDTRSDVYSLGVVLYEILTGAPPFDAKRLGRAALLEILRVIREVDPPSPSARLSTDKGIGTISASRRTEPSRLTRMVRGELDWIVMKALEKERVRRYDSASGLAQDLRSYLTGERVLAAPPSRLYRFRKMLKRNRLAVAAASLVFLSLVSGIIATTISLGHARYERNQADLARRDEKLQRQQAEAASRQAVLALQSFTDEFIERQFSSRTVLSRNDRALLQKALAQWESFASVQGTSAEAQRTRAEGQFRVARLRQYLGEPGAADGYRRTIDLLNDTLAHNPRDTASYHQLADARIGLGKLELRNGSNKEGLLQIRSAVDAITKALKISPDAIQLLQVAANAWSAHGVALRASGEVDEAAQSYDKAIEFQERVTQREPDDGDAAAVLAVIHNNYANLLVAQNRLSEGRQHYLTGMQIRTGLVDRFPDDPQRLSDLGDSHYGLGDLLVRMGDHQQAMQSYQTAASIYMQLQGLAPRIPEFRNVRAMLQRNIGIMWARLGNQGEALSAWREGVAIRQKLVDDFPELTVYHQSLATDRIQFGKELYKAGQLEVASSEFAVAIEELKRWVNDAPGDVELQTSLALAICDWALVDERSGQPASADEKMKQSLDLINALDNGHPGVAQQVSYVHWNYALLLMNREQIDQASEQFTKVDAQILNQIEKEPDNPSHWGRLRDVRAQIAVLFESAGRIDLAIPHYIGALEAADRVVELVPEVLAHAVEEAGLRNRLALAYRETEQVELADEQFRISDERLKEILRTSPANQQVLVLQAGNQVNRADLLGENGDPAARLELLSQAVDGLESILSETTDNHIALDYLQTALLRRTELLESIGDHPQAATDWLRLAELPNASDAIMFRSKAAQCLVRAGQTVEAMEIVESLKDVTAAPTTFARARIFAMAYGNTGETPYADQSVAEIVKLMEMGFDDADRLRNDPDLKSMQEYPPFQALIKKLEDGAEGT